MPGENGCGVCETMNSLSVTKLLSFVRCAREHLQLCRESLGIGPSPVPRNLPRAVYSIHQDEVTQ